MKRNAAVAVLSCVLAQTLFHAPALAQVPPPRPAVQPAPRIIREVAPGVYRVNSERSNWYSLFLVTDAGIVLVDPISTPHALWLKAELARRFPGKPVRYVIYSHSHWDHAEGGAAFRDTATFVGQENFLTNIDGRFPHMPGDMTDRNDNGLIDRDEIVQPGVEHPGICGSGAFPSHDRNGDGVVTPAEWYAEVVPPDVVFSERMTLMLGGERVDLMFPGKNHANDGVVVYLPRQRVVFSTDFPADALVTTTMRSLPSGCGNFDSHPLSEWVRSYRSIEALDFDILAQGHGTPLFTKNDVREGREFFEYLVAEVTAAMRAGKSLDEIKRTVMLERYKDWAQYDRLRTLVLESAYNNLKIYR